ncbi:hypothetical protein BN946_scf185003.g10 [Trametes cinnabarina]|uniref:Alpha/beta hydrolase fold-3 domain-containing protein n=1 Tax=Pycnoporus cinnabarinus TaxID=5643 RepID=A0A060S6X5_PYCCI|nr:hypothetical protein BN946_scf185003.g10 [Trametes cinnabarina]
MPVTTTSAAIHITPVVIKTFIRHAKRKGIKLKDGDTTVQGWDDILYDESFHIVKAFIELGTKNTVESLQAFTNTHVPAPFWCAVVPVKIPLSSCNKAADVLIEWFGPDDLKHVVGGERWWQVRGLEWLDAEWITEKAYLQDADSHHGAKLTNDEKTILNMEHLDRVMLYVHGDTHRYQVIRYARKMHGRAFTVNYRKAPQYPWPCPLQDVLAAYFYLTNPPPGAVHRPVHPSKLVLAGDSAGASLCLTALTILRDLGIPQPAGAVLISPWVDLTHSFPSVMNNASTDIIPPHGFIHKPSTLWPVHPKGDDGYVRVVKTRTNPPPQPGHADKLKPNKEQLQDQRYQREKQAEETGREVHSADLQDPRAEVQSQKEMQEEADAVDSPAPGSSRESLKSDTNSTQNAQVSVEDDQQEDGEANPEYISDMDYWEPKPPKVLMEDPNATPLELRAQIQLYATTEQLSHPLVSPVLQSSLGNLCPLYIIAGNGECLRDEIIYLAHKAAHPKDYPARLGLLREGRRQKENAEKFQVPTKVHLQVFDDMCHVLTVFTFTNSAKYAYRAIAQFTKHVIDNSSEHLSRNPFPELHRPPSEISDADSDDGAAIPPQRRRSKGKFHFSKRPQATGRSMDSGGERTDVELYRSNEAMAEQEVKEGKAERTHSGASSETVRADTSEDIPAIGFIRERVDVFGKVRPMEPPKEIDALRLKPQEIGIIKEAPVRRWLEGQEEWDRRFKRTAEHVLRQRQQYEAKAARLLDHAREQGLMHDEIHPQQSRTSIGGSISSGSVGEIDADRRWGPLDLKDENPPPSAIAGRRDTSEAVALLKKTIYHNAPATHHTVPKLKASDALRAVFDRHDHPFKAPQQSVSEQQVHTQLVSMHGLRMWQSLVELFMRKSRKQVKRGKKHASSALQSTGDKISTVGKSHLLSNP